ncbi:MAG TPA: stage II sporulation protein M [Thermoanaerobaculia bacterium]|nr:stage II sporulation protein M [Thermoanaerobaculia bacterium]
MDYARFVRLRRPIWQSFERRLAISRRMPRGLAYDDLQELALEYRQVLHDHALAAARYPGTGAARQLAALALAGTHRLTRGAERVGARDLVTHAFPRAFRRQLPALALAAGLFALAAFCGLVVAALQPALGTMLLGPKAVEELAQGRLWTQALTTTVPPVVSSSGIATNNLSVALVAWSGGVLGGIVPLYIILLNGAMLGALASVTLHYSMAGALLEFIAAHGPLEITLTLVASACGLSLGRALVAAGDRPRGLALREAARDALVVLVCSLPWFVVLALVETLVSPSPSLPVWLKLLLGCALLLLYLALALRPPLPLRQEMRADGLAPLRVEAAD